MCSKFLCQTETVWVICFRWLAVRWHLQKQIYFSLDKMIVGKYSWTLETICLAVKAFKKIPATFALRVVEEYLWRKRARKLMKENISREICNGFKPPGNLIKWYDLWLQVFKWQPCPEPALFSLYIYIETSCYFINLANIKSDFPVYRLQMHSFQKAFFLVLRNQKVLF